MTIKVSHSTQDLGLGHCCRRMENQIEFGNFIISDKPDDGFWGVKDFYIQTGKRQLDKDVAYLSPPFEYCPFCGSRLNMGGLK